MSKLYEKYSELKKKNNNKTYIFKSGIFYIALEEDAQTLSNLFGLKLTNLNDTVIKCGFPSSRVSYYIDLLKTQKVDFEIIDPNYGNVNNYSDYIQDIEIKKMLDTIKEMDFDDTTFKEAYEILLSLSTKLNKLEIQGGNKDE